MATDDYEGGRRPTSGEDIAKGDPQPRTQRLPWQVLGDMRIEDKGQVVHYDARPG